MVSTIVNDLVKKVFNRKFLNNVEIKRLLQSVHHSIDAGFTGIYHAVRMGEGTVTGITPDTRLKTARAAREAGLLIGTCVEPVSPEHNIDEIVEKIRIGRGMNIHDCIKLFSESDYSIVEGASIFYSDTNKIQN